MLAELALLATARAAPGARRVGLAREAVALWSRARRRRIEWSAHEARCHAVVRRAVADLPSRRTLVVLGSGLLRDIPFDELQAAFERILLLDAVHLPPLRARLTRHPNVALLSRDISGALAWMTGEASGRRDVLRDLIEDAAVDLVISANLLSQLPIRPEEWLEKNPRRRTGLPENFAGRLIGWHLDDLARFRCRVCLLTDVAMEERDRDGGVLDRLDLMRGHALPPPDETWEWVVAPFGEIERDHAYIHRVHAYADWMRAAAGGPRAAPFERPAAA